MRHPIRTAHQFRVLNQHLLGLLRSLDANGWNRPTVCSAWNVKDIASHLFDGNCRRLSGQRDKYRSPDAPTVFTSNEELVRYLSQLNQSWTAATRRMSPQVLIDLLELTGNQIADLFENADPLEQALFPVSWAGESESLMWFDIAREYTERWHHQRQIALAVERSTAIDERELYHPVLETFCYALPYTFQNMERPVGTVVRLTVVGPAGGEWDIVRCGDQWTDADGPTRPPVAEAIIPQEIAWRVFTKRMSRTQALTMFSSIELRGDPELAGQVLEMVSIIA
jgi:hypothetical protein